MTLEYVATPHVARTRSAKTRVDALSIWVTILAVVNLAAAATLMLAGFPAWALLAIFALDAGTICIQHRHGRDRS